MQHAAGELALADEHALDAEPPSRLVEGSRICPRAPVDVERQPVAVALEVLEPFELADAGVSKHVERHRLELTGLGKIEVGQRARVVVERRGQQDAGAAGGAVAVLESAERVLPLGIALLDRRPEEHPARARLVDLVEDDVAHRVAVGEHDAGVIRRPGHDETAVHALPERLDGASGQVDTNSRHDGLLARLDGQIGDLGHVVDVDQVRATGREHRICERVREAALDRKEVGHVVLVSVGVEHHQDLPEPRKNVEELSADELRILERDLRREQRLRHAARGVHRVQAQVSREVRNEGDAVVRELGLDEETRGQERLDPVRPTPRSVRRNDRHWPAYEATASSTASGMSKFA